MENNCAKPNVMLIPCSNNQMFKHIIAHADVKVKDGQISNHILLLYFQESAKTWKISKSPRGPWHNQKAIANTNRPC